MPSAPLIAQLMIDLFRNARSPGWLHAFGDQESCEAVVVDKHSPFLVEHRGMGLAGLYEPRPLCQQFTAGCTKSNIP